jgi:hypothetical protein
MLGYITQTNEFCSPVAPPMAPVQTGVGENQALAAGQAFRIYPNPTTGSFTLEMAADGQFLDGVARIFDIRGNKVLDIDLNGISKQVISLENQPKGMYFIRVINVQGSETGKVIKQ